jgi:hypothetical protein
MGDGMNILKSLGSFMFGVVVFAVFIFVALILLKGAAYVAEIALPYIYRVAGFGFTFSLLILTPLAFFKKTRIVSTWGFLIASMLFGLTAWMTGFILTYDLWGGIWIIVGMILGLVGVVPFGLLASAFAGQWGAFVLLAAMIVLTFGTRAIAFNLAERVDRDEMLSLRRYPEIDPI